jgi:peptidoglycan hydrolase CwlO-like protein
MRAAVSALAAFAGVAVASKVHSHTKVTAVQKVIELLEGMHKQGLAEKQDEEVKFSSYAQFCENTSENKTKAIAKAAQLIEKLSADIAKAKADASAATAEIQELSDDVTRWKSDAKAAAAIREKEALDFQATNQDYSETLDALDRAIATLKKQSYDRAQAESLLQLSRSSSLLSTKSALRSFLRQDPSETYAAPEANAYEFQSGGIVEMMESLQDKFKEEKSSLEKEELNTKHEFEQLQQTMADSVENAEAVIKRRTEYRGDRLAAKAEAEGEKADTIASKDADSKYLSDLKALCTVKQQAFDERQKLRGEELDAIQQAVEILGSGSVTGASEKHLPQFLQVSRTSFLQMSTRVHSTNKNVQKAAEILSDRAEKYGSNLLSMLATRVQANPFGKVKKMIRDMIIKLKEEATAETEHKGWCDAELGANKITRDEKTANVDELNAEIEELNATIAKLTQEVADLTAAVAELNKERTEATEKRNEEHKNNTVAIADAKEAQSAVAQALTVLEDFYAKAGEATSLAQTSFLQMKRSHLFQAPAEDAPETFNEPYKGMGGENGGVVGMLEVIQSDFARLESETSASEEAAAQEYTTFMNDTEVDIAVKKTDSEHKSSMITKKKSSLNEADKTLKTTMEELDAANAYYDKLKPSCVDSGISYEDRVKRREEEIQSLKEALQVLTGQ